jgi:uncharacterized oligopeptide transporter (OPT) family protein
LWGDTVFWSVGALHKASFGFELSPMFLGVGYLSGPRIAVTMLGGGVLGWTLLIPFFDALGESAVGFGLPATIHALDAKEIRRTAVRYVGAGAVATGGMVSLVRSLAAMRASLANVLASLRPTEAVAARTDRDLPGWYGARRHHAAGARVLTASVVPHAAHGCASRRGLHVLLRGRPPRSSV